MPMNGPVNNRAWKVLNWNIRGINSSNKWLALGNKIEESGCSIVCLQETKREAFDSAYIKKIAQEDLISLIIHLLWEHLEGS